MPDLPQRADIDQLRRQARELLRAAVAGEPEALARLRAVPGRSLPSLPRSSPSPVSTASAAGRDCGQK